MISVGQTKVLKCQTLVSSQFLQYQVMYSQVQWVEEEDEVLSLVVCEFDFLELVVNHSLALEIGCRFGDSSTMMTQDG